MSKIGELIKRAALDAVEASYPMRLVFGKVAGVKPVRIRLEQGLEIDDDFLIKTESSVDFLKIGDRVVLVQMQGGQQFLLIDRLVN